MSRLVAKCYGYDPEVSIMATSKNESIGRMTKQKYILPDDRKYLDDIQNAQAALFAYSVKDKSNKRELIDEFLDDNFGIEFSNSGMTKKLKQWSQMISESDEVANWHGDYIFNLHNVPRDNIQVMHRIWRKIHNQQIQFTNETFDPSYRMLKWWDYIIRFYGDTIKDDFDIITIGNMLSQREMLAEFQKAQFGYQDILCWLDAAPFTDAVTYSDYVSSKVPKLNWAGTDIKPETRKSQILNVVNKTNLHQFNQNIMVGISLFSPPHLRYLLPSQMMNFLIRMLTFNEPTEIIIEALFGEFKSEPMAPLGEDDMKILFSILDDFQREPAGAVPPDNLEPPVPDTLDDATIQLMKDAPSPYGNFDSLAMEARKIVEEEENK